MIHLFFDPALLKHDFYVNQETQTENKRLQQRIDEMEKAVRDMEAKFE